MCDCNDPYYEPPLCRKCWNEYSHCTCELDKARFEIDMLKKELKDEKARTTAVLDMYEEWRHSKDCTCEPAHCKHLCRLRSALENLRLSTPVKRARKKS